MRTVKKLEKLVAKQKKLQAKVDAEVAKLDTYSTSDVVTVLDIPQGRVRRMVYEGRLVGYHTSDGVRVLKASVDALRG